MSVELVETRTARVVWADEAEGGPELSLDPSVGPCVIDADRMRQALIMWNGDEVLKNHKYVMRITGDDAQGKAELDNFILPESKYPVIKSATPASTSTSRTHTTPARPWATRTNCSPNTSNLSPP